MREKKSITKTTPATSIKKNKELQIVAIGASAGGLEAITELLQNIVPGTGMVFIYIPHLSPDHKSLLTSLLAKTTPMKVQEVTDKILMKPDNLYIIPPDKDMTVLDGHIQLTARAKDHSVHLPIDTFFASLAEIHKENAIGVVLSGSANDGTRGLLAIKAAGGLTFAQNESAKFNSMPQSAVTAGAVDFVLSPKEIAKELIRISKYDYQKRDGVNPSEHDIDNTDPDLKTILSLLLKHTQVDFSHYKMPTIKRRILRRMLLHKITSLKEYAQFTTKEKWEVDILYQDLLINVTNFFRDSDAHEFLKTSLFPQLLKAKQANEKLRIWVPACATGEEAYSIAMTLLEIQGEQGTNIPVQIFASDLSVTAITKARIGEYSKPELEMVSPNRLQRFYTKTGSKYRIAKVVRDMCIFAPHNILRDPPFSKIDFISCCNLFIYLDTPAQKKALATFHYALNENGFLMLGKSETIGTSNHLFNNSNTKFKIYARKQNIGGRMLPDLLPRIAPDKEEKGITAAPEIKNTTAKLNGFEGSIDAILLSKYIPPCVIINHAMEIIQFRGETDAFLKHPAGKASLNVLKMTAPEIAFELRHCIPIAIKTKQSVRKSGIEVTTMPGLKRISIEVIPLAIDWEEPLVMIIFSIPEMVETFVQEGKSGKYNLLAKDRKIQKLEEELSAARADMHSYSQEQEAFIEEMQSANEEVVSSNEELQSVNEELETSKEEIESTNEELTTTNQELQTRNELLNESYLYSDAILSNIHDPLLVLDKDLRIVSASKSFYKKFTYIPEETEGILLYDIGNKEWDIPALRKLLEQVLPKGAEFYDFEVEHDFPRSGKKIMMLNATSIYQKIHGEALILLSIQDFTERKKAQQLIIDSEKRFEAAVAAVQGVVWTNNSKGEMEGEQKSWAALTGQKMEEYQGYGWTKAVHPDDVQGTIEAWQKAIKESSPLIFEHRVKLRNGEWGYFSIKAIPTLQADGAIKQWVGVHTNITLQKIAEQKLSTVATGLEKQVQDRTKNLAIANEKLSENNLSLQILNKELQTFSYVASHDLQEPLRKIQTMASRIIETESALSEKGKDYFDRIQKAAGRMQALIEDLLSYNSLNNVQGRKLVKTDLNVIIEEVKTLLSVIITETKATIIVKPLCDVNIIPYQFRQVMLNLISNALKFTKPGIAPVITIKSQQVKSSKINIEGLPALKEYCKITVADNGIGFEEAYNEKIFEIFQRLHDKDDYPGTGIGLAIVKKIVENHNGAIRAKGKQGKGTTFEIYLPV
ncbi:MAG TPA: chemotaxis protein CheB [Ferruginibacter sp.]|nr:chemotaxis protein CheB [Ferruginibacter sp.]